MTRDEVMATLESLADPKVRPHKRSTVALVRRLARAGLARRAEPPLARKGQAMVISDVR